MAWRSFLEKTGKINLPDRILFFDTTLRDGEQTPGVALLPEEKLDIAKQLDVLGVDMIEAGFPATSKGDLEAVKMIAKADFNTEVVALARSIRRLCSSSKSGRITSLTSSLNRRAFAVSVMSAEVANR